MAASFLNDAVAVLLARSLEGWHVCGRVEQEADGALLVIAAGKRLRICRAPAGVPFRWMVGDGERTRGVTSVSGLLRRLRAVVDPDHRPVRLRIAPLPPPSVPS